MIYVMSDIHGNIKKFNSVMEQINLKDEDTLYILGDVIDRHPGGIQILQTIMKSPNMKMLMGNHELMMLDAIKTSIGDNMDYLPEDVTYSEEFFLWKYNCADVTFNAFTALSPLKRMMVMDFLTQLPYSLDIVVNGRHFKLVHAAPPELYDPLKYDRYENAEKFSVWCRLDYNKVDIKDYILIFGHTPTKEFQPELIQKIWYGNNVIGIDCGAGAIETHMTKIKGRLACLRLDDMKEFYSEIE